MSEFMRPERADCDSTTKVVSLYQLQRMVGTPGARNLPVARLRPRSVVVPRRRIASFDQQRATQCWIKTFWSVQREDGARVGSSTGCSDHMSLTVGGRADPAERGVANAKAAGRLRLSPTLLNALSSFTLDLGSR